MNTTEKDIQVNVDYELIGTVTSDEDTPTFETVRVKLKTGREVKPGALIRIPTKRYDRQTILIGRIKSAYERNPNESPDNINIRDTLGMESRYPNEEDSTIIYRQVEADLLEEISWDGEGNESIGAPETLPIAGSRVYIANKTERNVCIRATPSFPDAIAGLALWDENKPSLVCSNGAILSTLSAE